MLGPEPRITMQIAKIFAVMLEAPSAEYYGLELARRAQLKSGTIYPALARLERVGWLTSRWEAVDPSNAGRPPRRLYTLTGAGERAANAAVADLAQIAGVHSHRAPPSLRPGEGWT